MLIRSTVILTTAIVTAAITTFGLGSPAFAASYGGFSSDTGNMHPSYYDQKGWHVGLPPAAQALEQQKSVRHGRGLQLPQNDWFWDGSRY